MNYLALVNRARIECGINGTALTSFASLSTEDQRIVNWVAEAWHDLQLHKPDWQWMKKTFSFVTIDQQATYANPTDTGVSDCADWKRDSFRCYSTAQAYADEMLLPFMDNDVWRNVYQFGSMRTTYSRPVVFTVQPINKAVSLGPVPISGYTIVGEYFRTPTDLVAITDDPTAAGNDLPARYQMLIVWMAARAYASYEAAPEVLQRAELEWRRLLRRLEFDQLPEITFGPPLA
jgi:hypothetical protein